MGCMGYVRLSSICYTELVPQLFGDRDYENSVAIIFFCNFQITRLYYPNFGATKNPNNNFMRNNILKCVHSIYTRL